MDINATLIGNTAAFLVFVLFCYKFVWPPLEKAISDRQQQISESLSAASEAKSSIEKNKRDADLEVLKAKDKAKEIVAFAERQAAEILEKANHQAQEQSKRLLENAHLEIEQERVKVEQELRAQVSSLAISIAEKILEREVSAKDNEDLVEKALNKL